MDDTLRVEAYELFIQSLHKERKELRNEIENAPLSWMFAFTTLANFIYETHGFDVLRSLAAEIDEEQRKQGKDMGFTDLVECDYGE